MKYYLKSAKEGLGDECWLTGWSFGGSPETYTKDRAKQYKLAEIIKFFFLYNDMSDEGYQIVPVD